MKSTLAIATLATILGLVCAQAAEAPNSATGPRSDEKAGQSGAAQFNQDLPPPGQDAAHGRWHDIEGTASGKVSLSSEQRQKIRQYFDQHEAGQVPHVDYTIAVGATVPRQAELKSLPSEVADILMGYRGDQYVLVQHQLVIVEPKSRRIVAIIPGEG
ncbi:MAG TPA: DUF1236 domain-containing protein [Xanthobacteraceae bacterium]|nr:DUF1236 domain-containing protein [Xanthobacteraceae bacterium]